MIPDNVIEEVKARNEISDVISAYVTLRKAGSNMLGLCPFHNEKTPSFTVFGATQSFYCFGCGAAGDAITFIRKIENVEYVEAVRKLAQRAGITVPEDEKEEKGVRRSRLFDMNKEAARFFRRKLLSSSEAREYFIKRGLSQKVLDRFGLGYAPNGFELMDHLKRLGYTEEEMLAGRLIGKSEKGRYPFFRNRVIFPIIDTAGSVIAFGGRVMDNTLPKYLNTPDTPAFNKGRNLFALNYARNHCKEEMILCEGYMDVIALHAAGFQNAVATLGTALTQEQARIMKRYTEKVIISYDGDNAGQAAADKASKILSEVGLEVRILRIKDAKDPDEYIKNFGADEFRRLLNGSETKFDFILGNVLSRHDVSTQNGKIKAAQELCAAIARVSSAVEQELYTAKAAEALGVNKEVLSRDVKRQVNIQKGMRDSNYEKQLMNKALGIGDKINPEHSGNPRAFAAEEAILGIIMLHPERVSEIQSGRIELTEQDFITAFHKRVFSAVMKLYSEGCHDIGALGAEFSQAEMGRMYEMQIKREKLDSTSDNVLLDNIDALKKLSASQDMDIEKLIKSKLGNK